MFGTIHIPAESILMHTQAIEDFPRNRRRLDGRDNRCKRCTARMVSARLKGKAPVTEPTGEEKRRNLCPDWHVRLAP